MALDTQVGNRKRTDDPQLTVTGQIKPTRDGEMLVFQFDLGLFRIVCLANIPAEGEQEAPVYVKFKTCWPSRKGNRAPDSGSDDNG